MSAVRTPGYTRVRATPEELAEYAAKHNGRRPAVERSMHTCGKRIWHSGLAVASHGRVPCVPLTVTCYEIATAREIAPDSEAHSTVEDRETGTDKHHRAPCP